jgi:hypothetical protein
MAAIKKNLVSLCYSVYLHAGGSEAVSTTNLSTTISQGKTLRRGPQAGHQCNVKGQFNLSGVALATPTVGLTAQYFKQADHGCDTILYS